MIVSSFFMARNPPAVAARNDLLPVRGRSRHPPRSYASRLYPSSPCCDTGELVPHLASVPVQQAHGKGIAPGVTENRVDGLGCEDAGQQGANRSARAVHAEGVK